MLDLRAEYVARFGSLPIVSVCEPHDGEFDGREIGRLGSARTPAIYVACMGVADLHDDGGPIAAVLSWVAMVIARGPDGVREGQRSGGDVAAALALRVVHELSEAAFPAGLTRPGRIRARNLFSDDAARSGYRLWGVEWQQATRIDPDDLDGVLHAFRLLHTDYDHGAADGTIDHATDAELEP